MGCRSCGNKDNKITIPKIENKGVLPNLTKAIIEQPDKIKWFKDGAKGIYKCITNDKLYTDEEIISNRKVCEGCEFATNKKDNGKLSMKSQCMLPDPDNNNAPCACFLICKTGTGSCYKWTNLTLNQS